MSTRMESAVPLSLFSASASLFILVRLLRRSKKKFYFNERVKEKTESSFSNLSKSGSSTQQRTRVHFANTPCDRRIATSEVREGTTPLGGHRDGVFIRGDLVWKRVQDRGRGPREKAFLEAAALDSRWAEFVPRLLRLQKDEEGGEWLVMDSLLAGLPPNACTMDIKMGTRTWGAAASPRKALRQQRKSHSTTSANLGVRITAAQLKHSDGTVEEFGQKVGRPAKTFSEVKHHLRRFLCTPTLRADAHRWLTRLKDHFEYQTEWCFYCSSLLLAYDSEKEEKARLRMCMIDFAHAHRSQEAHGEETVDASYLHGIRTLLKILENSSVKEEQISSSRSPYPYSTEGAEIAGSGSTQQVEEEVDVGGGEGKLSPIVRRLEGILDLEADQDV
eukprot:g2990.t1